MNAVQDRFEPKKRMRGRERLEREQKVQEEPAVHVSVEGAKRVEKRTARSRLVDGEKQNENPSGSSGWSTAHKRLPKASPLTLAPKVQPSPSMPAPKLKTPPVSAPPSMKVPEFQPATSASALRNQVGKKVRKSESADGIARKATGIVHAYEEEFGKIPTGSQLQCFAKRPENVREFGAINYATAKTLIIGYKANKAQEKP